MDTAVMLPWPIAPLVARGSWQHLAIMPSHRWPRSCMAAKHVRAWRFSSVVDDELGAEEEAWQDGGAEAAADLLQPRMFLEVADVLRRVRPIAENQCATAFEADEERARMEKLILWSERCMVAVAPDAVRAANIEDSTTRGGHYFKEYGAFGRYVSEFFIKVLAFSFDLRATSGESRNGSYVGRAFKKAMRLLPPAARKMVHDMYEEGVFPSPATMSRSSLFVDVAFMRILADRHAQYVTVQCLFFTLSDGSPQNGRLYQITEYYCVGQFVGDFDEVGAAACRFRCFPKDPALITADMLA